jgi:hypothetical protein
VTDEEKLRELMRDPRWSLAPWPDAQSRVRRAARKQRRAIAGAAAAVALLIAAAAAVTVPAVLSGSPAGVAANRPVPPGTSSRPSAADTSPSPAPVRPTGVPSTPPVGSADFPVSIYPAPKHPSLTTGALALCPDPAGLEDPGPLTAAAARSVLGVLSRGPAGDLRVSDRSAWPLLTGSGTLADQTLLALAHTRVHFAGPLQARRSVSGELRHAIAAGCGSRVADATWVLSFRQARQTAPPTVLLFVTRRGHMLFYGLI